MIQLDIQLANFEDCVDSDAIVSIVNAYAIEPPGGGKELSAEVREKMIPGLRQTPGAFAILARCEGQAVGVAVCFRGFSTFTGKPLINVHDLSVLAEFRGLGVGTRLLAKVEELARSQGCSKVTLEVREVNPLAERLYRRLGYGDPSGFATRFLDKPMT